MGARSKKKKQKAGADEAARGQRRLCDGGMAGKQEPADTAAVQRPHRQPIQEIEGHEPQGERTKRRPGLHAAEPIDQASGQQAGGRAGEQHEELIGWRLPALSARYGTGDERDEEHGKIRVAEEVHGGEVPRLVQQQRQHDERRRQVGERSRGDGDVDGQRHGEHDEAALGRRRCLLRGGGTLPQRKDVVRWLLILGRGGPLSGRWRNGRVGEPAPSP